MGFSPWATPRRAACVTSTRLTVMVACALSLVSRGAVAQEDSAEDHGSRAVRKAQPTEHGKKRKKRKKTGSKRKKAEEVTTSLDVSLGLFGGTYWQAHRWAPLVNASVEGGLHTPSDDFRLELAYEFDPFSTKTFNFPEEDEAASTDSRLTQPMHDLTARAKWARPWNRWVSTKLKATADWWLPQLEFDERRAFRVTPEVRVGKSRGVYGEVSVEGFYKKFPNYEVADRKLDQDGITGGAEVGYTFAPYSRMVLGTELSYTRYLDARYEVLNADGSLSRATESKTYFERSPFVLAAVRPIKSLRTSLRYMYELNDSNHYDRRMTGRINGDLIAKFIPDYYDYRRHRLTFRGTLLPTKRWRVESFAEGWLRNFDSYEARDADNTWLGEARRDTSLELGLEATFQVTKLSLLGAKQGLYGSLFGSHLRRRSNMQRETSIATNFDVTRIFVGVELQSL